MLVLPLGSSPGGSPSNPGFDPSWASYVMGPSPGVNRIGGGNTARMEDHDEDLEALPVQAAWIEAAGVVQSDQDADLRLEARGLMVAEMAEVDLVDRLLATRPGRNIRVLSRDGTWLSGRVQFAAVDHLVLDCRPRMIVPTHAICALASLPRVLHHDPVVSSSWRSTLRDHLGTTITVSVARQTHQGRVTWVGRDHISIEGADGELTVAWPAIDHVAVTVGAQPPSLTSVASTG